MLQASADMATTQPDHVSGPDATGGPVVQTLPETADAPVFRYCVRALREPSVLARVVEMFTLRDVIPQHLTCRDCPERSGEMLVELVAAALTPVQAENIAARMDNIVPVLTVRLETETA